MGQPATSSSRRRAGQLGRWVWVSLGAHLLAALALVLGGLIQRPPSAALRPGHDVEVEVVDQRPGQATRRARDPRRASRPAGHPRSSSRRPGRRRLPAPGPGPAPERPTCSPLTMRGCDEPRPPRSNEDGFASFFGGRRRRGPEPRVVSQAEANGVQLKRYADGGRLLTSTRGGQHRPDLGTVGLLDLSHGKIGGRNGRSACNPYRNRWAGQRTLVLLVDTSASIDAAGRSSKAVTCAAGAALAALERGYEVEVLNFSSTALHQPPTRDPTALYATLSTIQRRETRLPHASRLVSSSARPRDFVLITDSAIGNLHWTLPAYRRATRTHPRNRALLYLLGDGVVCPRCHYSKNEICYSCSKTSRQTLVALQRAGFVPRYLDQPTLLEQLLARKLRQLWR